MRRPDFNSGLLLAGKSIQPLLAQASTKQRRLAIVAAAGKPENISEAGSGFWHAFFLELRHLGDFKGGDLIVERLGHLREVHDMVPLSHIAVKCRRNNSARSGSSSRSECRPSQFQSGGGVIPQSGFPDGSTFQNMILSK